MKTEENPAPYPFENPRKGIPYALLIQLGIALVVLETSIRIIRDKPSIPDEIKEALFLVLHTTIDNIFIICDGGKGDTNDWTF